MSFSFRQLNFSNSGLSKDLLERRETLIPVPIKRTEQYINFYNI